MRFLRSRFLAKPAQCRYRVQAARSPGRTWPASRPPPRTRRRRRWWGGGTGRSSWEPRLAEPNAEQDAFVGGVGQARGKHMVVEVKAGDRFLEGVVFVHRHDVLKTKLLLNLRAKAQGADHLSAVNAVEQVAVMDQEAGPYLPLVAQAHKQHVEAENLHVLDALAALALHRKLEHRPVGGFVDGHAAGRLVESLRCFLEGNDGFGQPILLLGKIAPQPDREPVALDLQLVFRAFELLGRFEALPQGFHFRFQAA